MNELEWIGKEKQQQVSRQLRIIQFWLALYTTCQRFGVVGFLKVSEAAFIL